METGALIVAAGKSSRMGSFKPMLNIGNITIAERILANFRQAGITKIVMITGYQAAELEHHLASHNIVFLRNEAYETTHMFDSVKIGLSYLKDKVDRILFTPVDVPLFTAETVCQLLQSTAQAAVPYYEGKAGHPILLSCSIVDALLSDCGEAGLAGALSRNVSFLKKIPVSDGGIIHDADTPDDYQELLSLHNQSLIRVDLSISISKEKPFFNEQLFTLLTLIDETGSVREACSRMHISYSTSWNLIRKLESQLNTPLLFRMQGGAQGSHSELTPFGKDLIYRYDRLSRRLRSEAASIYDEYFGGFWNE